MPTYKVSYVFDIVVEAENEEAALSKATEERHDYMFCGYEVGSVEIEEIE